MRHTPKPWTVYAKYNVVAGRRGIANAGGYSSNHDVEAVEAENMANANLIAAAPDLLDALEKCPLPSTMGTAAEHYQRFYNWYQAVAVPAIQKAGGLA